MIVDIVLFDKLWVSHRKLIDKGLNMSFYEYIDSLASIDLDTLNNLNSSANTGGQPNKENLRKEIKENGKQH